jgi:hypothetical protein
MWTWLSLAAFVYCLFRWCCELIRRRIGRAEPAVQQNVDAQRTSPDQDYLLINDPDDDAPPVAAIVLPKSANYSSPNEELALESIIGASSPSFFANGVRPNPIDDFGVDEHEYDSQSLTLDADESASEHWGFFATDMSAMRHGLCGDALQTEMSVGLAESLAEREGLLRLDYLASLTPEVARALAKHKGELALNGLTELLPEVAWALAEHKGFLQLNGLTTLTRDAAEALSQSKSLLRLSGLATLSPEAAEALAEYDGLLFLKSLETLSPEAVAALRANPGIKLPDKFKK